MVKMTEIDVSALGQNEPPVTTWKTCEYAGRTRVDPCIYGATTSFSWLFNVKISASNHETRCIFLTHPTTALDKYVDACLSIPGPPPPQLLQSYSSLCENIAAVVGCTVTLNRDPQTGGFQHANYWTALKRDWKDLLRGAERSNVVPGGHLLSHLTARIKY